MGEPRPYSPSRDDLEETMMPAEWVAVADGVMPFNREAMIERAAEAGRQIADAMAKFRAVLEQTAEQIAAFARAFLVLGRRGPRLRRSGHRHVGTRDHRLRFAPSRKDVPLGYRTIAKARELR